LTSITGGNVTGTVANATFATSAGTAATVTTAAQPNITSLGTLSSLTVSGDTNLGAVGNVTITGGSAGYVLTTDGSGSLTWNPATGGSMTSMVSISKETFVATGSEDTYLLSTTPVGINAIEVVIDGLQQISNTYSLTGSNVTFSANPVAGQIIEITNYGVVDLVGNATEVLYNNGTSFATSSAFTFDDVSNTLSTTNITATGNLTSQGGYVYVDTALIAVSTGNAGIFNTGVSNINIGLGSNVTLGSTSGLVTARGTLSATDANIGNLIVNNYVSGKSPVTITTDTVIDAFPVNDYRSAKYTMRVNSDAGYQAVEVLLVHDGSSSFVTIYGSISSIGRDIVSLSTDIDSGNVRLLGTTADTNTTVKLLGTYVPD
jgi:hypothetical protein